MSPDPNVANLPVTGKARKATITVVAADGVTYTAEIESPEIEMSVNYSLGEADLNELHYFGTAHFVYVVAIRCGTNDSEAIKLERVSQ